jgi:hypothetical protein
VDNAFSKTNSKLDKCIRKIRMSMGLKPKQCKPRVSGRDMALGKKQLREGTPEHIKGMNRLLGME